MPSIMTHAVVGGAAAALVPVRYRPAALWWLSAGLAALPDLDVVGVYFHVARVSMWAHRGISHSLLAALIVGSVVAGLTQRRLSMRWAPLALFCSAVMASHGVLDGFTHAARGIAYFAPFDTHRYLFAFRPIPGAPFGLEYFSHRGLLAFKAELLWVWVPVTLTVGLACLVRLVRRPASRQAPGPLS